jgi:haloacetate dehalogenase
MARICADLRGYGASHKPPDLPDLANYSFRAMAADQIG